RLPDSFRAVSFTFGHDASSRKGRLSLAFAQQATAHVASRLSEGRLPSNQPRAQLRSMLVQRVQRHFRTKALRFLRRSARSSCSISMPDLNGFETAALTRERQRTRETSIIFVTAIHRTRRPPSHPLRTPLPLPPANLRRPDG